MLKKLLESLELPHIQHSHEGVYHVNFDDELDVACIENSQFVRFESLVVVMPSEERSKCNLLTMLLARSAQISRIRSEGLYIDRDGASVLLQRNVYPQQGTSNELKSALTEFLCGLEAWRSYATPLVRGNDNSLAALMRSRS